MKNQFNLNIKTPCQENFSQFTQTTNGGFCDSCEQEVIDFTKMTAEEINNYFSKANAQNTCGRFKNYQLNTFNQMPLQRKKTNLITSIGFAACLTLFAMTSMHAQDTKGNSSSITQQQETFTVKGTVSDELEPIPGVNILLEGTTIGTQTDFDGNFEFPQKLKKGDVLVFSYVGLESQKVLIENKNSASNVAIDIELKLDTVVIMGKVATKEIFKSNRSK